MHLLFSYARRAEPPLSRGGYPPLVRTADEAAPRRRGQRSKSQVHAPTFTGNLMRPAAAGLSALLAEGKIGRKWRTQSVRNSHACGMTA